MKDGLTGIIDQLERRKAAIERAIAALREIEVPATTARVRPIAPEPSKPKRRISAEGIRRIIAATKKRWRLQRAAAKAALAKKTAARKVVVRKARVRKSEPASEPAPPAVAQTAG